MHEFGRCFHHLLENWVCFTMH